MHIVILFLDCQHGCEQFILNWTYRTWSRSRTELRNWVSSSLKGNDWGWKERLVQWPLGPRKSKERRTLQVSLRLQKEGYIQEREVTSAAYWAHVWTGASGLDNRDINTPPPPLPPINTQFSPFQDKGYGFRTQAKILSGLQGTKGEQDRGVAF